MNCSVPPVVGKTALVYSFFLALLIMNQFDVKSYLQSSRVERGVGVAITSPSCGDNHDRACMKSCQKMIYSALRLSGAAALMSTL